MVDEVAWFALAAYGIFRAVQSWQEARLDIQALDENANGRRLVAEEDLEHAALGFLIYATWLAAGTIALGNEVGIITDHMRLEVNPFLTVAILLLMVVRQDRDAGHRRRYMRRHP